MAPLEIHAMDAQRLTDRGVGEFAGIRIQAERQRPVLAARLLPCFVGDCDDVRQCRVGQRIRRRMRHRARHNGHAVERRVVHRVRRIFVGSRSVVLEADPLVDRDVDQDRSRLHSRHQVVDDSNVRKQRRLILKPRCATILTCTNEASYELPHGSDTETRPQPTTTGASRIPSFQGLKSSLPGSGLEDTGMPPQRRVDSAARCPLHRDPSTHS